MNPSYFLRSLFLALCLSAIPANGFTQAQPAQEYKPEVGQEGKDVVWVPTPQALVDKMLDLSESDAERLRHRLGLRRRPHGDPRQPNAAPRRTALSTASEMVELSKRNAAKEGVSDRADFRQG